MRILQVTPRYPPRTGGVETHVEAISERLVERGHTVEVHTADDGADVESRERRNGVLVVRHRGVAPGGSFHIAPGIIPAVNRATVDVVHAHNYHSLPVLFAAMGVGDRRLVVTPHYHGASAHPVRNHLLTAYRPVGAWIFDRADAVVAVSEWEHRLLVETFDVDATVIPNGIDGERFRDAEQEPRTGSYILTVGRLEAYKGIQHIVRALPHLPSYDLVVVGTGPYRDELEETATDLGVDHRVEFLGYVDEDRLPSLYAGAAVYVTLSEFEAYGMTVAESLAAGTPCVLLATGGLSDWVGVSGVVALDPSELAPTLVSSAIGSARGRPVDMSVPDWDEVTAALEELYSG